MNESAIRNLHKHNAVAFNVLPSTALLELSPSSCGWPMPSARSQFAMFRQILHRQMSTKRPRARPGVSLDPSYEKLLKDIDATLANHGPESHSHLHQELEVLHNFELDESADRDAHFAEMERKSPAALFGSQDIGAVVLPHELRDAIHVLINGTSESYAGVSQTHA